MNTYTITEQKENTIITDWAGNAYNGLREIVEQIKNIDPPETPWELNEILRLALWIYNGNGSTENLTAETIAELWEKENDAYAGEFDTEADFAEDLLSMAYGEAPSWLVVDWQGTYNYALQFDYYNYEARLIEGDQLIMLRFFWRAY